MSGDSFIQRFEKAWLFEMPMAMRSRYNPTNRLIGLINNYIQKGNEVEDLGENLWRIVLPSGDTQYYWKEEDDYPMIAVSLTKFGDRYAVQEVGKNPNSKFFATDFYWQILDHLPGGLLLSDSELTRDGIQLWRRMFNMGLNIMAYDPKDTKGYESINSEEEFEKFFDRDFEDYRFVLSKDKLIHESIISQFQLLRTYKLGTNIKE